MSWIKWFREISKNDVSIAGGKGANLGELYNNNFPVPPGFVITTEAYDKFIRTTGIDKKIEEKLANLNIEDTDRLDIVSQDIRDLFTNTSLPQDFIDKVSEVYRNLHLNSGQLTGINNKALELINAGRDNPTVAVRSSATAEDLEGASFAGQQATFLNVKGIEQLIKAIKECWASLFTSRAIYYREKNKFPHDKVSIAVVIQQMINSIVSGVMFSINPATNDENQVVIEAAFGLGEAVVSGEVNPEEYILDKQTGRLIDKKNNKQEWMYTRDIMTGKTIKKAIPQERWYDEKLPSDIVKHLWSLALKVEKHYGEPQDMEWALDKYRLYLVQARSVTTLKKPETDEGPIGTPIVKGLGASPGSASGPVRIILSPHELSSIQKGDVLVTKMTNPDMVPAMQKAVAIVTDEGGITSHASIVSREMMIPCVVGTEKATSVLQEGEIVTVNGTRGEVYKGNIMTSASPTLEEPVEVIPTNIKVKVIVDLPDYAERIARTKPDGVGLVRLEGIIAEGGKHPAEFMREGKYEEYVELIESGVKKIASAFPGKPIWVRTSDIRSDEFRNLIGGDKEDKESNPMMGWHGIRRSLDQIDILKAEFEAIKRIQDSGFTNVGIMIPQVISYEEVQKAKDLANQIGLNGEFGVMIETPAAALTIEKICDVGIDFISFGTNDLTQFTLGVDRNNTKVQKLYNELHPAVLREISHVIQICKKRGVKTSICGQAGSNPNMVRFLVEIGIDSISANPDAVQTVRKIVAEEENARRDTGEYRQS